ncbi:hypothetical protein LDL59_02325 [Kaistella anthropi]|nr:hypothetical protein [Kaistella anthropi]
MQDGVPVKEWSIQTTNEQQVFPADLSENNTQLLSFKSTAYRFDKMLNGDIVNMAAVAAIDRPNVVTATVPVKSVTKDFTKEVRSETTIWYDKEEMEPSRSDSTCPRAQ